MTSMWLELYPLCCIFPTILSHAQDSSFSGSVFVTPKAGPTLLKGDVYTKPSTSKCQLSTCRDGSQVLRTRHLWVCYMKHLTNLLLLHLHISMSPLIAWLTGRFNQLKLKEDPFRCSCPASEEEIAECYTSLQFIESSLCPDKLTKKIFHHSQAFRHSLMPIVV
jgi:hypothetical protein